MKRQWLLGIVTAGSLAVTPHARAALVTFDEDVQQEASFAFDGDGDGIDDVVFATTDFFGFSTVSFGRTQQFIDDPALEGTSEIDPDLRVDFLNGAINSLSFGFALNSSNEGPQFFASISVFNSSGDLLASASTVGAKDGSDFPEGVVDVAFDGIAAYATFNFTSQFGRYIMDNFAGTFGSTEPIPTPEPAGLALLGLGLLAMGLVGRRRA
jgi:hypothetical protein